MIFNKFREAGMTLNLNKSDMCKQEVKFLGYKLTNKGIERDNAKIKAILEFPSPRNQKQLKGFLGLTNFYNKFLEKYSDLVQPLLNLTSEKNTFIWTDKKEKILKDFK